jgi:hypothetical protein
VGPRPIQLPPFVWVAVWLVTAFSALLGEVGADARWLAALGGEIARLGSIPAGVPYAALPSAGWENAPVLGELAFHALQAALGERGLLLAQALAVLSALTAVALDLRARGAAELPSSLVLLLVAVASAPALLVARAQLFSLALFPLLALLLRAESGRPSWRLWLLPALLALWSNLHGGALLGLALACCYLLLDRLRRRPVESVLALALSGCALFATPALLGTADYYRGVLGSEAALRGEGLWGPLSLARPLDLAFLAAGLPLLVAAFLARPRPWEAAGLLGLAASSAHSGRTAVWLVIFASSPAAAALTGGRSWRWSPPRRLSGAALALLAGLAIVGLLRPPLSNTAGPALRRQAALVAAGRPVLADAENAEALALDGQRVWIANPLDAFPRPLQRRYLDWLAGRRAPTEVVAQAQVVLVRLGEPAQRRLDRELGFREVARDERAVLYARPESASLAGWGGRRRSAEERLRRKAQSRHGDVAPGAASHR